MSILLKQVLAVSFVLTLYGCGGGGGGGSNPTTASGTFGSFSAKTNGATCELETGEEVSIATGLETTFSGLILAPSLNIPTGTEVLVLTCTGGTYIDEATGVEMTAPTLRAVSTYDGGDIVLVASPITEVVAQLLEEDTVFSASNVQSRTAQVADAFGLDDIDVAKIIPTDLNDATADNNENGKVGIILAAISQLASASNAEQAIADLYTGMSTDGDLADGVLLTAIEDLKQNASATSRINIRESAAEAISDIAQNQKTEDNEQNHLITSIEIGLIAQVGAGNDIYLNASIEPSYASNPVLTWISSDDSVATVNDFGRVSVIGEPGEEAIITVSATDGSGESDTFVITVQTVVVTGVSITNEVSQGVIGINEQITLISEVLPADATNANTTWQSSDDAIATVDENGVVTGVSVGDAQISVTTADGGYVDNYDVEVVDIITFNKAIQTHISRTFTADGDGAQIRINSEQGLFTLDSESEFYVGGNDPHYALAADSTQELGFIFNANTENLNPSPTDVVSFTVEDVTTDIAVNLLDNIVFDVVVNETLDQYELTNANIVEGYVLKNSAGEVVDITTADGQTDNRDHHTLPFGSYQLIVDFIDRAALKVLDFTVPTNANANRLNQDSHIVEAYYENQHTINENRNSSFIDSASHDCTDLPVLDEVNGNRLFSDFVTSSAENDYVLSDALYKVEPDNYAGIIHLAEGETYVFDSDYPTAPEVATGMGNAYAPIGVATGTHAALETGVGFTLDAGANFLYEYRVREYQIHGYKCAVLNGGDLETGEIDTFYVYNLYPVVDNYDRYIFQDSEDSISDLYN